MVKDGFQSSYSVHDQSSMSVTRAKSTVIGTDWFTVLDRLDEKTVVLRNNNKSIENRYHTGFVKDDKPLQEFCTGSSYAGQWNVIDFCGYGKYHYPHGVTYEGYFENGLYHGNGTITYKIGQAERVVMAKFEHGKLIENSLTFKIGSVEINPSDFNYCKMPDRRFEIELGLENLKPVGQEYITNSEQTRKLEPSTYDVGYGIFDGKRNITQGDPIDPSVEKRKVDIPNERQENWIRKSCRRASDEAVGIIPSVYECWMGGRNFELKRCGFAPKTSVVTIEKDSYISLSKSSTTQNNIDEKEVAQRGGITRIIDAIEHAIEIKETKGDMCGKDSISDTEARLSIFSILEYLDKQYIEWMDTHEEYQKTLKSSDYGLGQALTEDIKEYLKHLEPDQVEEQPQGEQPTVFEATEILSDVDFSLEDMTLTDDEGIAAEDAVDTLDVDVGFNTEEEAENPSIIDVLVDEKEDDNEEKPKEDDIVEEEKVEESGMDETKVEELTEDEQLEEL